MAEEFESKLKKKCLVCGENIELSARKCIHCDSFQDWKRYLWVGNSALALLVALISVVTLSLPSFKSFVSPPTSRITPVILSSEQSYVDIALVNSGSIDGLVVGFVTSVGSRDYEFRALMEDTVIEGRTTNTIRVDLKEPLTNYSALTVQRQSALDCSLTAIFVDMPGNLRSEETLLATKCNEFFVER